MNQDPSTCLHEFVMGPFFIQAASSGEEPIYYSPQASIRVEHCPKCGLLRLPAEIRNNSGSHLANSALTANNPYAPHLIELITS